MPGPETNVCPVVMDFQYAGAFGVNSANGYERLLLDAMLGDQTLFAHRDGVEADVVTLHAGAAGVGEVEVEGLPQLHQRIMGTEGCRWVDRPRWTSLA